MEQENAAPAGRRAECPPRSAAFDYKSNPDQLEPAERGCHDMMETIAGCALAPLLIATAITVLAWAAGYLDKLR